MKYCFIYCMALFVSVLSVTAQKNTQVPKHLKKFAALYKNNPRAASLAWFEEARLGMFIHWGVWGKYHAAWAMYNKNIPLEEYEQTAREVDASGFDANAIVKLAKESGMQYITFVAKHHDGFCLWNSKFSAFDSWDYPMKRDFLAELVTACNAGNMPLFIYYSLGIDWTHPYFIDNSMYKMARPNYAVKPAHFKYQQPADFEHYRQFCKNQLKELCTNYGSIAGFWFDPLGGVLANSQLFKIQDLYNEIHQYQPHALIHFKTGITGTEDVLVGERELRSISSFYKGKDARSQQIARLADSAWQQNIGKKAEVAVTSQRSWEWNPDYGCASPDDLWKMLQGAAAQNANLLLNFGPKPDGSIPNDVATNFRLLGKRILSNGYPALNKTTWLEMRKKGVGIDNTELDKTAR